jgi:hypothetical protein
MTINGWMLFRPVDDDTTNLTLGGEFPGTGESMAERIRPTMELRPRLCCQCLTVYVVWVA